MKIAVVGAGSLGSLLAGLLADTEEVTLIGREGPHLDAIDDDGLTIVEPSGHSSQTHPAVTTDHGAVADSELLMLSVKSYDTEAVLRDVRDFLGSTTVLTLQNGLGNVETIGEFVRESSIIAGSTTHGALQDEPGRVKHTGGGLTKIGCVGDGFGRVVETVAQVFERNGIETAIISDVHAAIWEKVLVNVGINAATALARVPNGRLVSEPAGERLLERAVEEAIAVVSAEGYTPREDIIERAKSVAEVTAGNRSSMLQDIVAERHTEIGALNGAIVRRGKEHDIPVPVNRTLSDTIRLAESQFPE